MKPTYVEQLKEELERIESGRRSSKLDHAMRTGDFQGLSWTEMNHYLDWIGMEKKDTKVTIRISGKDLMKIKFVARQRGARYQTYLRDIVKREVRLEEERMAGGIGGGEPESR